MSGGTQSCWNFNFNMGVVILLCLTVFKYAELDVCVPQVFISIDLLIHKCKYKSIHMQIHIHSN